MKLEIQNITFDLTSTDLENLTTRFTLWNGRRFFENPKGFGQKTLSDVSLNELIRAARTALIKKSFNESLAGIEEARKFLSTFEKLKEKGYARYENMHFFVRLITKIKHCFAEMIRKNLLSNFSKAIDKREQEIKEKYTTEEISQSEKSIAPLTAEQRARNVQAVNPKKVPTAVLIEAKKLMDEYFDLVFTTIDEEVKDSFKDFCLESFKSENGASDYKSLKNEFKRQMKALIHDLNKENFGAAISDFHNKMRHPVLSLKTSVCAVPTDQKEKITKAYEQLSRCGIKYSS